MTDSIVTIQSAKQPIHQFSLERNWESFNTPKNLVMALAVEAGELLEHFYDPMPTKTYAKKQQDRQKIEHEIADVFFVLAEFCISLKVDISDVFNRRLKSYDNAKS